MPGTEVGREHEPTNHSSKIKELQMVTAMVILSFIVSIVLVLVAISQIDA